MTLSQTVLDNRGPLVNVLNMLPLLKFRHCAILIKTRGGGNVIPAIIHYLVQ